MNVTKIIPLSKLTIDTKKGDLLLESDHFNLSIKELDFINSYEKFSKIKINGNKAKIIKSSGDKNTDLIRFLVTIYNIIYNEENMTNDVYIKIINNIREIIKNR